MARDTLLDLPITYTDIQQFCIDIKPFILDDDISPDIVRKVLFTGKGWRLSYTGHSLLVDRFKSYKSTNAKNKIITGKIMLHMDICCNSPWRLQSEIVTVFDPMLQFELQMVNGDLDTFINFKSTRN